MNGYVNGEYWFSFETENPAVVLLLHPFYPRVSVAKDLWELESLKDQDGERESKNTNGKRDKMLLKN